MSNLTLEQKLQCITKSSAIGELPLEAMPHAQDDTYYFVSYSHLDYKHVYSDILRLQAAGLGIWYDRGMPAGKNWRDIAEDVLSKPSCMGCIFYISEHSLRSGAVQEEIELVKKYGKDFLSVNLPIVKNGKQTVCSASEMLDILPVGNEEEEEKRKTVRDCFSSNVIYLSIFDSAERKAEKIKLLKPPEQIMYEYYDGKRCYAAVKALKTLQLKNVKIPAEVCRDGRIYRVTRVEKCAFANAKKLESVIFQGAVLFEEKSFFGCDRLKLVSAKRIHGIGEDAFWGCEQLKTVFGVIDGAVGKHAFWKCERLEQIELGYDFQLCNSFALQGSGIRRFRLEGGAINLYGLREGSLYELFYSKAGSAVVCIAPEADGVLTLPMGTERIEDGAITLKEQVKVLRLPTSLKTIGKNAFSECVNLKEVVFYGDSSAAPELEIESGAFSRCEQLESIALPANVTALGMAVFSGDRALSEVLFSEGIRITALPLRCFASCHALRNITLPSGITELGESCFDDCFRLERVMLEEPITLLGVASSAFAYCYNIQEMTLPKTLKRISSDAYSQCINLKRLVFEGTVAQWDAAYKKEFSGEIPRVECADGVAVRGDGTFPTIAFAEAALNKNADREKSR